MTMIAQVMVSRTNIHPLLCCCCLFGAAEQLRKGWRLRIDFSLTQSLGRFWRFLKAWCVQHRPSSRATWKIRTLYNYQYGNHSFFFHFFRNSQLLSASMEVRYQSCYNTVMAFSWSVSPDHEEYIAYNNSWYGEAIQGFITCRLSASWINASRFIAFLVVPSSLVMLCA
jgi:hypothetical protein